MLIKHGADVNKATSAAQDKVTPLMIAAQRGDLNIARLLVQSGAAVEVLGQEYDFEIIVYNPPYFYNNDSFY